MSAADRKLVEACELLVEHGQYIPDTFTHELLRIVREVSK